MNLLNCSYIANGSSDNSLRDQALLEWHKILLESMRKKEDNIGVFVATVLTAIGVLIGVGLKTSDNDGISWFFVILIIQLLGTVVGLYSLALGYTFRMLRMQVTCLQQKIGLRDYLIPGWGSLKSIRWFDVPPETILVFFWFFLFIEFGILCFVGIILGIGHVYCLSDGNLTLSTSLLFKCVDEMVLLFLVGIFSIITLVCFAKSYKRKYNKTNFCINMMIKWDCNWNCNYVEGCWLT